MTNWLKHVAGTITGTPGISSRRAGGWMLDVMLGDIGAYAAISLASEITVGLPLTHRLGAVAFAAAYGGVLVFRRVARALYWRCRSPPEPATSH